MITKNIKNKKIKASEMINWLFYRHPYIAYSIMLVVIPIGMLTVLSVIAAIVMFPISFLLGWI